jgi:XapX domain-containing protein
MPIREIEALGVGMAVGFVFARLGLPAPAPNALAGVLGILGIYLGMRLSALI